MTALKVQDVFKQYGSKSILDHINFEVEKGAFATVLGPSGCGKTTLLRVVSGFVAPDRGRVWMDGEDVTGLAPEQRGVGIVFQNYALFPHMTVFDNVAFGLRMRRWDRGRIEGAVDDALLLTHLKGMERRYPHQLSGGEQQRVALARVLVTGPHVLLLDEPLSALDRKIRMEMRQELKRIQRTTGVTTVMVTHDQEEALYLSDQVVVMDQGQVAQVGSPGEVYLNPGSETVARFIGDSQVLEGDWDGTAIRCELGAVHVATPPIATGPVRLVVRPEAVRLCDPGQHTENVFPGEVSGISFQGPVSYVDIVGPGGTVVTAVVLSGETAGLKPGQSVYFHILPDRAVSFARQGGKGAS
jgi:ABC-type Fe3+/spermidine/putrescine transport system ATPase subunit